MQPPEPADVTLLAVEAARYLAAVEVFRREGHEPHWQAEGSRAGVQRLSRSASRVVPNSGERSFQ